MFGRIVQVKILSWNVNGLRAVHKRGFLKWLAETDADIVCLQEVRSQPNQLQFELVNHPNYHVYFNPATKKGYAGVAVYTKKKPEKVERTLGLKRFDDEGRILRLEYPEFTLINLYMPHGDRSKKYVPYKLDCYTELLKELGKIKGKRVLVIGDFNIAHKEVDLARPKQNQKNTMFTPEEREQMDKIVKLGFMDTFRKFHKEGGNYTWWPYYADARRRNLGWRLDYAFASKSLVPRLKSAFILKQVGGSDHCPIGVSV